MRRQALRPGLSPYVGRWPFKQNLPNFTAALAAVRAGTRNAKVLCIGDSITCGKGGANGPRSQSFIAQAAALLQTDLGVKVSSVGFLGTGTFAPYPPYDGRVAVSAALDYAGSGIGGNFFHTVTVGEYVEFTPGVAADRLEVCMMHYTGNGQAEVLIDGVVVATIDTGDAPGLRYYTYSTTLATHTIRIRNKVAGVGFPDVFTVGFNAYNSAVKEVQLINAGWGGSTVGNWISNSWPWEGNQAIPIVDPDLTLVELTINDWLANTAVATYQAQLAQLLDTILVSGSDALVFAGPSSDTAVATAPVQAALTAGARATAASKGVAFLDFKDALGDYAAMNAKGLMVDSYHVTTPAGHALLADLTRILIAG